MIPELCLTVNWSELEYFIFPSEFFRRASLSLDSLPKVGLSLFSEDLTPPSGLGGPEEGSDGGKDGAAVLVSLAMTALRDPFLDFGGLFRLLLDAPPVGTMVMLAADDDEGDGSCAGCTLGATGVMVVEEGRLRCFNLRVLPGGADDADFEEGFEGDVLGPTGVGWPA